MLKQTVIDSNVLVALVDRRDKWHEKARTIFTVLEREEINRYMSLCASSLS